MNNDNSTPISPPVDDDQATPRHGGLDTLARQLVESGVGTKVTIMGPTAPTYQFIEGHMPIVTQGRYFVDAILKDPEALAVLLNALKEAHE
jgi:hypothetical protein